MERGRAATGQTQARERNLAALSSRSDHASPLYGLESLPVAPSEAFGLSQRTSDPDHVFTTKSLIFQEDAERRVNSPRCAGPRTSYWCQDHARRHACVRRARPADLLP